MAGGNTYNPRDDALSSYEAAVDAMRAKHLNARKVVRIGNCELILGDCMEVMPQLGKVDAVVTDPPYGISHKGCSQRFSGGNTRRGKGSSHGMIVGDDKPFDPAPILLGDSQIIFGANNFSDKLPPGSTLVWSKRRPEAYGSFLSDGEVAWFSTGRGVYLHQCIFAGSSPACEYSGDPYAKSAHPFQKPLQVMRWCLGFIPKAETILDPFMGSGTTGVACVQLQRKFIGIELDETYFDIACKRIAEAYKQPSLFPAEKPKPRQTLDMFEVDT